MKIYIGADHRGYDFKQKIIKILEEGNYDVVDAGTDNSSDGCDYPKIAVKVASHVAENKNNRGILVCMSGVGQTIAANKVRGAYAALCCNTEVAMLSRQHNNANILVLSAKFVKQRELNEMIKVWLITKFEGGRHLRRVKQIKKMEKEF